MSAGQVRGCGVVAAAGSSRRLSSQGWLSLVLAALVVLVAAGATAGAVVLQRTAETSNRLSDRIAPASTTVQRFATALAEQDSGVRGYALTADRRFLAPYERGRREQDESVARLRKLLADEPDLRAGVDDLAALAGRWQAEFAAPVIAAVDTPGGSPADLARFEAGERRFEEIRGAAESLTGRLAAARDAARVDLADARRLRDAVFTAILAAVALAAVAVFVLLRLAVLIPLHRLRTQVRTVAAGDFGHAITGSGPADLRELSADVEAMRVRATEALAASADLHAGLERQAEELRRSNAELEQFAYVASHDLQEPLRKVASFCQLLERRYAESLDDRGRQYIAFAVDGAVRMQSLINALLEFSRVGRVYDSITEVDLDGCLDAAINALGSAIRDSGAVIHRTPLPTVTGEPTLLTMLMQNLVGNAIKFHRDGVAPEVTVGCEETADGWRISVTDNGIGVDAEFAEKIFVLFQRLHSRERYPGTGIGLALCRKIAEHHGGRIYLDTAHTGGTRIEAVLPVSPAHTPVAEPVAG